jgi:hypothetical protein
VIVSYDGKSVTNDYPMADWKAWLMFRRLIVGPGKGLRELKVRRAGTVMTFRVAPGWGKGCSFRDRVVPETQGAR